MMGHGSFGHGSSSSLSPLAPPFKLNPTPQLPSQYPFGDFSDYSSTSAAESWLHLHPPTSISDTDSIYGKYGYSGSESHMTQTPSLSSTHVYMSMYGPEVVSPSALVEAEPYYPKFQSPLERSPRTDFASNLSGFGYSSQWAGPWLGNFDGEQKDSNSSLKSQAMGKAVLSNYGPVKEGGLSTEAFMTSEDDPGIWHGISANFSARKEQIRPNVGRPDWQDGKCSSSLEQNANCFHPYTGTTPLNSISLQETPYSPPAPLPVLKAWNPFNLPHNGGNKQLDSYTTDPTILNPTKYFPPQSVGQHGGGTNPHIERLGSVVSKHVSSNDWDVATSQSNEYAPGIRSCNPKHLKIHISHMEDKSFADNIPKETDISLESLNHSPKRKPESENSHFHLPNTFSFASGTLDQGDSQRISSETFDQLNHAVDSPCWKGASSLRYSPFAVPFTVKPQPLCNGPVDKSEAVSSPKLYGSFVYQETGNVEDSSSASPRNPTPVVCSASSEYKPIVVDKTGSDSSKNQKDDVVKSSDIIQESVDECVVTGNPKSSSELKTSDHIPMIMKGAAVTSANLFTDAKEVSNMIMKGAAVTSANLFTDAKEVSNRSSGISIFAEGSLIAASECAKGCPPKVDPQVLVKMIHNLSELLLSSHHCDVDELREQDYETLQLVIDNLDACVLVREMPESFVDLGCSNFLRKSTDSPCQGNSRGRSFVTMVKTDEDSYQPNHEKSTHSSTLGKRVNRFDDIASESTRVVLKKDTRINQAIKKPLKENLSDVKETDLEAILYKNLWVEAEAALLSMKYELQLAHMKIEMERNKDPSTKDASNNSANVPINLEESPTMEALVHDNMSHTKTEERPMKNITIEDYINRNYIIPEETNYSNTRRDVEDVESSVMARYRILQNRLQKSHSAIASKVGQQCHGSVDVPINLKSPTLEALVHDDMSSSKSEEWLSENITIENYIRQNHIIPEEPNLSNRGNEVKDAEPSILARFKILQNRLEKSQSAITSQVGIEQCHDSTDPEHNVHRQGTVSSYPSELEKRQDVGMDSQLKGTESFGEKRKSLPISGGVENFKIGGRTSNSVQTLAPNTYVLKREVGRAISEVSQAPRQVKCCLPSEGSNSPSTDWEHVLKEELSWQN